MLECNTKTTVIIENADGTTFTFIGYGKTEFFKKVKSDPYYEYDLYDLYDLPDIFRNSDEFYLKCDLQVFPNYDDRKNQFILFQIKNDKVAEDKKLSDT
jgi:hypothetical protein